MAGYNLHCLQLIATQCISLAVNPPPVKTFLRHFCNKFVKEIGFILTLKCSLHFHHVACVKLFLIRFLPDSSSCLRSTFPGWITSLRAEIRLL